MGLMTWFRHCYDVELEPASGRAFWRRVALPGDGGIGEQDARLLNALEYMATVYQRLTDDAAARRRADEKRKAKDERQPG